MLMNSSTYDSRCRLRDSRPPSFFRKVPRHDMRDLKQLICHALAPFPCPFVTRADVAYLIDPWLRRCNGTPSIPQLFNKLRLAENYLAKPECTRNLEQAVCKASISFLDQARAVNNEAVVLAKDGPRAVPSRERDAILNSSVSIISKGLF